MNRDTGLRKFFSNLDFLLDPLPPYEVIEISILPRYKIYLSKMQDDVLEPKLSDLKM